MKEAQMGITVGPNDNFFFGNRFFVIMRVKGVY